MRAPLPVAVALLGALVSGCSDGSPALPPSAAVPEAATATPVPTTVGPVAVTLRHFPAGLAVIGLNPSVRRLSVEIRAAGLAPGTTHPARLMSGSCAHPGAELHALDPLVAGADTIADTSTTVNGVQETAIPAAGWSLAVDSGTSAAGRGLAVLCGDLDNPVHQAVVTAGLSVVVPRGGPDPHAAGTAMLSIVNGQLKVVVDATGLTPGSSHAVRLRRGNCEGEGAVLHPLEALPAADASGHATSTTLVPGVGGIPLNRWFVGISAQPAVLDPVLCGNVGT